MPDHNQFWAEHYLGPISNLWKKWQPILLRQYINYNINLQTAIQMHNQAS